MTGTGLTLLLTIFSIHLLCASFSTLPKAPDEWKALTLAHVRGLKREVREEHAGQRMQAVFSEGACFTLALYGLAWARIAATDLLTKAELAEALEEILWAVHELDRDYVLERFTDTQVRNGVFWLGQRNLLLGRYLSLLPQPERPTQLVNEFHIDSQTLAKCFTESPTLHLDSYPELCWPADNVTALRSIVLHDELYETNHRKAFEAWKDWTEAHTDPATALPAGHLFADNGTLRQPARGCATSWIVALLSEMDSDYARTLYERYQESMMIQRLGLAMFREYPKRSNLRADIDSGPIIWDAGVVATGVGLATSLAMHDWETANDIHALTRILGFKSESTRNGEAEVRHLFGKLPVGDAFLAWGYTFGMSEIPTDQNRWFKSGSLWAISLIMSGLSATAIWRLKNRSRSESRLSKTKTPR